MYISSLKILLKFETTSLYENIHHSYLSAEGEDSTVELVSGGNGYIMKEGQYLYGDGSGGAGFLTSVSNAMTFGFWLYPTNIGMATNPGTGAATSITLPLIDIVSGGNSIIRITEHTTANDTNYMKFTLNDTAYVAQTPEYTESYWHHFWIVYDGSGSSVTIYIDGVSASLTESGSIPATISGSTVDMYVNHSLSGYAYNVAKNKGYLDDFFLFNTANTTASDIQRTINMGIEYVGNDVYTGSNKDSYSIYFDDPTTITINSAIDDMSYIYLARNDGKILRGSPRFWECRKVYSNPSEEAALNFSDDDNSVSGGFLKLKNTVIRL